ncbi:helix-turn-helix transcriptional regulator [Catellatospora citrea]|uniref:Transcriptional regulator n=1 Tax=Catellatospora citrea TaxID=53366 RepID=A0A8J3KKH7_9ACTN|nr:WYL domain-containing protein [Catellatospora citrea]RKE06419.1 putative DNA-binding transcriptional regulator YafY [Catellatospora citrea]GIG02600.1 transcriptional regulator [Catellatospora citrea]
MKASRLVSLLLTLQQRRSARAAELAQLFEVSVRTVYRDVAALQAAGVPLWTEPGRAGGIRLLDGWRTRLDGLTGAEAAALFAGAAPAALAELGLGSVLLAAQAKVLATLPEPLRDRARTIAQRFHLDAPGWFHRGEELPHLMSIAEAVWEQRRVTVRYRRADGSVRRVLEPYGLVLKAGVWYLVARVPDADAVRTYRLVRITAVEPGGDRFERPADFALAQWWTASAAAFDRTLIRDRVRLRVSPHGLRRLPIVTDAAARDEAILHTGPPDERGWCEVELAVESPRVALTQLLPLGADVEILAPEQLRAEFAAVGAAIAARNA